MKTAKSLLIKLFVAAAMLLLAQQSHALTTPYMVGLSNQLSFYYGALTNSSFPSYNPKEARAVAVALRDLRRPTTSVAQDYDRFFLAVLHLGKYTSTDPILVAAGANISSNFIYDAALKIGELSARTTNLNRFVSTRKAAVRSIELAYALLVANLTETNQQTALVRGRRIFSTLTLAERLVVLGENRQGFAPEDNSAAGAVFNYVGRGESGIITLTDASNYTNEDTIAEEILGGTYTYTRTGLNTATLVLSEIGGGVTTLRVIFRSLGAGRYSYTFLDGADRGRGAGSFTYSIIPPPG